MGVKGLRTYVTQQRKDISEKINIRDEVEKWSMDHDERQPIIVIDLKELPHALAQRDERGIIFGGRYPKYNAMLNQFFQQIKTIKATFIFFAVGKTLSDSIELFIIHAEQEYMTYCSLLDIIESENNLDEYLHEKNKFSADVRMTRPIHYNIKKICRKYGEIRFNYQCYNAEIANYIRQNSDEVLAIITNDTDFLAFEGNFQYWSSLDLQLKTLDCVRFSKERLRSYLELNAQQMQLLSALSGHDFLPREFVKPFWDKLAKLYNKRGPRIENLATYIKSQPMQSKKSNAYGVAFDLKKICEDVFETQNDDVKLNAIVKLLDYYNFKMIEKESNEKNIFLKYAKKNDPFIYKLATDNIFNIRDIAYIDYRNYKSKNYAELIVPILLRLCGILFKDERSRPTTKTICMKFAHDEPSKLVDGQIIYPAMELCPLFDLIYRRRETHFDEMRWSLFSWVLNLEKSFIKKLRNSKLHNNFKVAIITLTYLLQEEEITKDEANAFLLSEDEITIGHNKCLTYAKMLNAHYIRLAHLYTKMYIIVNNCLEVCGLHSFTDILRFDGANLHKILDKLNTQEAQPKNKPIWTF